jgi:hypothetical protein
MSTKKTIGLMYTTHRIDTKKGEVKKRKVNPNMQPPAMEEMAFRSSETETDLTVVVGAGAEMKEFQCNAAILAFASKKLDLLVANSDGKLFLPHLNPDDWNYFYECIEPSNNGNVLSIKTFESHWEEIDLLSPFFREFEMGAYFKCCSDILQDYVRGGCSLESEWGFIKILHLAVKYEYTEIKDTAEVALRTWYERDNVDQYFRETDFEDVLSLVSMCLPIQRESAQDSFTSTSSCSNLWLGLRTHIETHLKSLTFDKVEISDCEWFAHVVHGFFRIEKLERQTLSEL